MGLKVHAVCSQANARGHIPGLRNCQKVRGASYVCADTFEILIINGAVISSLIYVLIFFLVQAEVIS